MRLYCLTLVFLFNYFTFNPVFGNPGIDSSLVKFSEIQFASSYEEAVFHNFLVKNEKDYFALFLCNDSTVTGLQAENFRSKLHQVMEGFGSPYYLNMHEQKRVARIYSSVHEEMLDKYVILVPFSSIFTTGEFHCVSSTMLYTLVFDFLDIPYEIRIKPNHVYLMAYPATHFITVETTDPLHGTLIFDQTFKGKFIEYLRDAKLISKEEFNSTTTDILFEKYFNKNETIDLAQLASLQYYNQSLKAFESLKFKKAAESQEKAWLLNPDARNTYLLLSCWLMNYSRINKNDIQSAVQLGKLSRFMSRGITPEIIISEFAQITQRQLLYEGNEALYDSSYHIMMDMVIDSALKNELSFIYNYERGRILCNNLEYKNAFVYTKKAFQLKPKNVDAKNNLLLSLNNILNMEEPQNRLLLVNEVAEELPLLLEDNFFAQLRLSMFLVRMYNAFLDHQVADAEHYRKEFEAIYPERNQKYSLLESDIENIYGSAALYYFKKGQANQSRAILEKALQYAPNSISLKRQLEAVK